MNNNPEYITVDQIPAFDPRIFLIRYQKEQIDSLKAENKALADQVTRLKRHTYYLKNKEAFAARSKAQNERIKHDPEAKASNKASQRGYYERNREAIRAKQAEYYQRRKAAAAK